MPLLLDIARRGSSCVQLGHVHSSDLLPSLINEQLALASVKFVLHDVSRVIFCEGSFHL